MKERTVRASEQGCQVANCAVQCEDKLPTVLSYIAISPLWEVRSRNSPSRRFIHTRPRRLPTSFEETLPLAMPTPMGTSINDIRIERKGGPKLDMGREVG